MKLLNSILLLLICHITLAQESAWYYTMEPADPSKKALEKRYNALSTTGFQVHVADDTLFFAVGNPYDFGRAMRKGRDRIILNNDQEVVLKYRDIRRMLTESFLLKYADKSQKYQERKEKYIKKVLKGKTKYNLKKTWVYFSLPLNKDNENSYSLSFSRGRRQYGNVTFTKIKVARSHNFPWFENTSCTPFNRWTHFLKDPSYGPRSFGKLPFYSAVQVDRSTEEFVLLFDKNSISYSRDALAYIENFLKTNDKGISKVVINGFSSVEGDSLNNVKLHEKRAEVLISALEKHADTDLEYKVNSRENWDLFEKQVLDNDLPELSRIEWKMLLENDSVQRAMEPFLSKQRNASTRLYLFSRRSEEQIHLSIVQDMKLSAARCSSFAPSSPLYREGLARMLAIREYVRKKVEKGKLPIDFLIEIDSVATIPDYFIYSLFAEINSGKKLPEHQKIMKGLALKAFNAALYKFERNPNNRFTQSDLLAIQKYIFECIESGYFEPEMIYKMVVPDEDRYVNLTLNLLAFRDELIKNNRLKLPVQDASEKYSIDSRYYYLLKKIALGKAGAGGKLKALAIRSDWYLEFDLAYFLYFNINNWEPFTGNFYDPEVSRKEMHQVLHNLLRVRKNLCPYIVEMLQVGFYERIIQEGSITRIDGKLVREAFSFLESYYMKNKEYLTREERVSIAGQIIAANNYFFFNEAQVFSDWLLENEKSKVAAAK